MNYTAMETLDLVHQLARPVEYNASNRTMFDHALLSLNRDYLHIEGYARFHPGTILLRVKKLREICKTLQN